MTTDEKCIKCNLVAPLKKIFTYSLLFCLFNNYRTILKLKVQGKNRPAVFDFHDNVLSFLAKQESLRNI